MWRVLINQCNLISTNLNKTSKINWFGFVRSTVTTVIYTITCDFGLLDSHRTYYYHKLYTMHIVYWKCTHITRKYNYNDFWFVQLIFCLMYVINAYTSEGYYTCKYYTYLRERIVDIIFALFYFFCCLTVIQILEKVVVFLM